MAARVLIILAILYCTTFIDASEFPEELTQDEWEDYYDYFYESVKREDSALEPNKRNSHQDALRQLGYRATEDVPPEWDEFFYRDNEEAAEAEEAEDTEIQKRKGTTLEVGKRSRTKLLFRCLIQCRTAFSDWSECDPCRGSQTKRRLETLTGECAVFDKRCRRIKRKDCQRICQHGGTYNQATKECNCPYGTNGDCCEYHGVLGNKFD